MSKRFSPGVVAGLLIACFCALALWAAVADSVTVDEFAIVPSGYAKLTNPGELNWLNPVNPPLIQGLVAVPWLWSQPRVDPSWWADPQPELRWSVGYQFMGANLADYDALFLQSRLVAIGLGVLLIVSAWRWSRWLYGDVGGLMTLALCAWSPSLLAHAHLATVDVGATAFLVLASYHFHRFITEARRPFDRHAWWFAIAFALALGSKYTAALCIPVYLLLAVIRARSERSEAFTRRMLSAGILTAAMSTIVIGALYGFDDLGAPLPGALAFLPSPFPAWFVGGLEAEWSRVAAGRNLFYFFGDVTASSHPGYFLTALAVKEPVPHLILAAVTVASLFLGRRAFKAHASAPVAQTLAWFAPVLALWFLAVFSLVIGSNLGIRYVLFAIVCLYVGAGHVATLFATRPRLRWIAVAAIALSALSVSRVGPHFISYFNEFAGGPAGGRWILSDSNLDWGQDLKSLRKLMETRGDTHVWLSYFGLVSPGVYGIQGDPLSARPPGGGGLVAVSVHQLNGIDPFNPAAVELVRPYRLRRPIATAGYSILLFDDR